MLAQDIIRRKRDGGTLDPGDLEAFARGLVDGSWSEAQAAALAMAICCNGLSDAETVGLTRAMTRSGESLDWSGAGLDGPVLDKHSTGGVGDKVSLLLAPIVAACGGFVPMISGRGLGHTGGTLDKLASIPGYQATPSSAILRTALQQAGCAIVGASAELAPADRRLYAIRDVTATVESVPLITASILAKKLAAGLQGLVMDVKLGNGAFATELPMARALARTIVRVAQDAGLPTRAWITDMNQVLGRHCGNALEVREVLDFLDGREREPRLLALTRTLGAEMLMLGGLAGSPADASARIDRVLDDGRATERFARMVHALGGPADFIEGAGRWLPAAPACRPVVAPHAGWIGAILTREIGWSVVELGGGRRHAGDAIDPAVGIAEVAGIGQRVEAGAPLAWVHAADATRALETAARLQSCFQILDEPVAHRPVLVERVDASA